MIKVVLIYSSMQEIDRLSIGIEHDAVLKQGAEEETSRYRKYGELPRHFELGGQFLREQIQNGSSFYVEHKGKFVMLISTDPLIAEIGNDRNEVIKTAYARWGLRPLHGMVMDPDSLRQRILRPRLIRAKSI